MNNRTPPLLEPYLQLPPQYSLSLISSVLGASANWLIIEQLCAVYGSSGRPRRAYEDEGLQDGTTPEKSEDVVVVLVSFMRDWDFWRTETKRAGGLDLRQLQQKGRFAFIDGLSRLFLPPESASETGPRPQSTAVPSSPAAARSVPTRVAPSANATASAAYVESPSIDHLQSIVLRTINELKTKSNSADPQILCIFDTPTILLQTTEPPAASPQLLRTILQLRAHVHAMIVSVPADDPFMAPAAALELHSQGSAPSASLPLEVEIAAFVVGLAHQSRVIMQCRKLGTGWAADVSGVLRITRGGVVEDDQAADGSEVQVSRLDEGEWLYRMESDGSVKVWSRGANI